MKTLTIAIDGPSASGKGTLAKKLAQHFNLPHLDTGAIYRLIAYRAIEQKIDLENFEEKIPNLVENISAKEMENEELFTEKTGAVASIIAKSSKLRAAIFDFQINFVANGKKNFGGAVLDGRDTTTVICKDADFKFYVEADVEIRAKRRFDQLIKQGKEVAFDEILSQLKTRDDNDKNRKESPLIVAKDAVIIDNGRLTIEEGFQKALQIINNKIGN